MPLGDSWGSDPAIIDAVDAIVPGASQAARVSQSSGEDYLSALARVAQAYVTSDAQRKLLKVQLDRAQRGLAPLDSSQYGLGVNVGLSPDLMRYAMFGGLALLAVFLLKKSRG